MTPRHTPDNQRQPNHHPTLLDGFDRVSRTRRREAATRRLQRRQIPSVEANRQQQDPPHHVRGRLSRARPSPRANRSTNCRSSWRNVASAKRAPGVFGINTRSKAGGKVARSRRKASRSNRFTLLRRTALPWSLDTETPNRSGASGRGRATTTTCRPVSRRPRLYTRRKSRDFSRRQTRGRVAGGVAVTAAALRADAAVRERVPAKSGRRADCAWPRTSARRGRPRRSAWPRSARGRDCSSRRNGSDPW